MQSEENMSIRSESVSKGAGGCARITEEEFEFQSKVLTKEAVRELVNLDAYERLMAVKGTDPANWNWQLHDKAEGYFPTNEEEKFEGAGVNERANDDFQLDKQLAKVDDDLKKEARANNHAILKAVTGVFYFKPNVAAENPPNKRRTSRFQ